MNATIGGEFGMEGTGQARTMTNENGLAVVASENFDIGSDVGDEWSPNEDGVERSVETEDLDVGLEGIDLTSVGVASHRHRNGVEVDLVVASVLDAFREQDHASAGAEERQSRRDGTSQRIEQTRRLQKIAHGGALPTRNHDSVETDQMIGTADQHDVDTEFDEDVTM